MNTEVSLSKALTLAAHGWSWRYAGREAWAVEDLTLQIPPGQRVLLLGASGSGKSTVLAGMAGLLSGEDGEERGAFTLGGVPTSSGPVRGEVALVQQDPDSQVVMEQVGDEVAFGLENLGVSPEQIWPRVEQALAQVGLDVPLDHPTHQLSGGEKQRLALASALAMEPGVLLLDEPTSNLDPAGVREVRASVASALTGSDTTLIIIEHRVATWVDLVDRIVVLSPTGILADGEPGEVLTAYRDQLLAAGIWVPGVELPVQRLAGERTGTCLQATDLTVGYEAGEPISVHAQLDLGAGISTCLVGANGAGKTTLALTLAGLLAPLAGSVTSAGHVQMVFQEPSYQFLRHTVREELELSLQFSDLSSEERAARVDQFLELMRLRDLADAHPQSLSGGEKRRLSVATGLIGHPPILLLDEPTFGQDRNTWLALVHLLQDAVRAGTSVIVITHDEELVEVLGQEVVTVHPQREIRVEPPPPSAGILDRVNPLFRLVGLALMTVPMFFSVDLLSAAVALALVAGLLPLVGWGPRQLLRRIWPLLVAAPLAGISMLLYARPGGTVYWSWGPAAITQNSVELSLAIAIRVLALGIPAIVLLSSAQPTRMADALTQVAKLPPRPVLAALAGIRLMSLMLSDWQALGRARRSRGVAPQSKWKEFFTGSFSLLTFALRRASSLSVTMEARGFGAPTRRSNARTSPVGWADLWMVVVAVVIPTLALGVAVWAGSFRWFGI